MTFGDQPVYRVTLGTTGDDGNKTFPLIERGIRSHGCNRKNFNVIGWGELMLDARFMENHHPRKMKKIPWTAICALNCLAFLFGPATAGLASTNQADIKLIVELHDGSRVVGQSVEKNFKFHSALFGDLKLPVKDIREVECVSSNAAKLVTANDDTLTVWFVNPTFAVNTSFGKVELAADAIRKLTVSTTGSGGTRHPGLVALWSGEDNGKDSVGTNDAELTDIAFADGKAGRAFLLNGFSSWMKIPAGSSLDIGKGNGLTIAAWIKPSNVIRWHPILEWNAVTQLGVQLWIGHLPQDQGVLFGNIVDDEGNSHALNSASGALVSGHFQHVALTYDKASGMGRLLINGYVVAQENLGTFTPQTSYDLLVSRRPGDHPGDWTYNAFFAGLMDEISIYNRALPTAEIQAICLEDSHGESLPPPSGVPGNSPGPY